MSAERIGWPTYVAAGCVVLAVVAASLVVGSPAGDRGTRAGVPTTTPTASPAPSGQLTFGVWGTPAELAAYRHVVAAYDRTLPAMPVRLQTYGSADQLEAAVTAATDAPDIYLLPRADLAGVMLAHRNRPVQELLADRGVSLGDDYSRDAVTAFSADDDLQCMPYTASPMVIYYNTDLIDFGAMTLRGLEVPAPDRQSFTMDEFRAAARFATRDGEAAGLAIDPTLTGLAPFIYSGGGELFDNSTAPTSLALGQGGSVSALRDTLEVLRDARLTLTTAQLAKQSTLRWFEQGKVAMIAGYRSLVPALRKVGVHFDVLPMPSLGGSRTVGDFTGVCLLAGHHRRTSAAADFLAYVVGDRAMSVLARVGSVQPSDLRVAYAAAFQQPGQEPAHASVFTDALRNIETPPLGVPWGALEALVDPDLTALMYQPGDLGNLNERLDAIDLKSQTLLAPATASPSP